jgi:hypothetical protein
VLLSVGREPTLQAYFERGALFYNALTQPTDWREVQRIPAFGFPAARLPRHVISVAMSLAPFGDGPAKSLSV